MGKSKRAKSIPLNPQMKHKNLLLEQAQSIEAKIRQEIKGEAIAEAFLLIIGIPIKILKEKHSFSDEILKEIAEDITDEYQKFAENEVSFEEYQQVVWDTCGIRIQKTE